MELEKVKIKIKKLMIAIALLSTVIMTIYFGFGIEPSLFTGVVVGLFSWFVADIMYKEKEENSKKKISQKIKEKAERIIDGNGLFYMHLADWTKFLVLIIACPFLFSLGAKENPTDQMVIDIQYTVNYIFSTFILIYIMYSMVSLMLSNNVVQNIPGSIMRVLSIIFAHAFSIFIIGNVGDDVKRFIFENQNESIVLAVSFLIACLMLNIALRNTNNATYSMGISGSSINTAKTSRSYQYFSDKDLHRTAAHESGHVMLYGAIGYLPENIKVFIDEYNGGGYTTSIENNCSLKDKVFTEWFMMMLLAGQQGELAATYESSLGSINDNERWLHVAEIYLSNHFDDVYYNDPKNKFQQELNEEKIVKLKEKQIKMLKVFFEENITIFNALRQELYIKKTMVKDDLDPIISKLIIPEEFPRPTNEFEEFNDKWKDELETK